MTTTLNHFRLPGLPVIACEYPAHLYREQDTRAKLAVLANAGVQRVVDLTTPDDGLEPYTGHLPLVRTSGAPWSPAIEHFPIADTRVPRSMVAFDQLVHTLARDVAAGIPIAVHCWGGVGRTGMVAAALLVRFGWPVHEALTEVNRLWRATPKVARDHHRTRTAPETEEQCAFVEQWARECAVDAPVLRPRSGLSARDARGCLLGGALGDALGAAVEFMDLTAIRARYGAAGVTRPEPAYGVNSPITDDTQMTLFTAEGLLCAAQAARDSPDASFEDVMGRAYVRWLITQDERAVPAHHPARAATCGRLLQERALFSARAPGNTCLAALREAAVTTVPVRVANNKSKGCGTVMRVAPIGLVANDPAHAYDLARRASALTHGHATAIVAGGAFAALLTALRDGAALPDAIAQARALAQRAPGGEETVHAIDAAVRVAAEAAPEPPTPAQLLMLGEGWVADEALSIALCCALAHADDFMAATRLAANLVRGDSDSTASMTGQVVGLLVGPAALPAEWLTELELRGLIEAMADALAFGA
jgi:ADP-ribosylglycohydrolase